jgi:trehalose 6-phosphate phosphatase
VCGGSTLPVRTPRLLPVPGVMRATVPEAGVDHLSTTLEPARSLRGFDAVILDLDGVVTRTAALHRIAWKQTFDELLRDHPRQAPFDDEDYLRYVDGKPRLDGARSFLSSRDLELPEGDADDTLADRTVRGVGNDKNRRFLELLRERGAEVFADAVDRVRAWKNEGIPAAIVSSSRNCRAILESSGLADLFSVRVDGTTLVEQGMKGKPAPDMFEEAARRLGATPDRAVVFEDAIAGVEAARRGGFGLVVGVDRSGGRAGSLRERGADVVIETLAEFVPPGAPADGSAIPRLLDHLDDFRQRLGGLQPALFLDYDGTLTPIVSRPEQAIMDEAMRSVLRHLAAVCTVSVVSGRDRRDVRNLVGLDDIVYAGSHGFDIRGPEGLEIGHEVGKSWIPQLDKAEQRVRAAIEGINGAQVERKRYTVAVHYRNAADADVPRIDRAVEQAVRAGEGLRRGSGKKVFEILPDLDWDKGRAVLWLIDALGLDPQVVVPIYVGDDVTDEDAFKALRGRGVGVVVDLRDRRSAADYRLEDVEAVRRFLQWLADERGRRP